MGIRDKPIAPSSPWQNGVAERLIGSIRRECLDHVIVLDEGHLRRILKNYAAYYNGVRTHRSLHKDAPVSRPGSAIRFDITPAPLAPADATAAFLKGSVDAWSIWDPYLALAELKEKARVIAFDKDVHKPNAFYIAGADFVEKFPSLVARLNAAFASEGGWADAHHEEVAKAQAEATGVDIEAIRRFVDRSNYQVVPVDGEVIRSQQIVADRFAKLGLITKPVNVSDIVWKWTPGS
jgi:hypothetical protein